MILFIGMMGMGISIGAGAMALALMNLPIIVRVTEESLKTVPREYREASLALGATKVADDCPGGIADSHAGDHHRHYPDGRPRRR